MRGDGYFWFVVCCGFYFLLWVLCNICEDQWSLEGEWGALVSSLHGAANTSSLFFRHWKSKPHYPSQFNLPVLRRPYISLRAHFIHQNNMLSKGKGTSQSRSVSSNLHVAFSQVLQTRSRVLWCMGEVWHEAWGWYSTTMKVLPGTQTPAEQHVLYLLYLYLPTFYTLRVTTELFLGHFRNIHSAGAISERYAKSESVVTYTSPARMYTKQPLPFSSLLLLATPREKAHQSVGKMNVK